MTSLADKVAALEAELAELRSKEPHVGYVVFRIETPTSAETSKAIGAARRAAHSRLDTSAIVYQSLVVLPYDRYTENSVEPWQTKKQWAALGTLFDSISDKCKKQYAALKNEKDDKYEG